MNGTSPALAWIRLLGSSDSDLADSIAVDATCNIFITGEMTREVEGDEINDVFVAKFNPQGQETWRKKLGSDQNELIQDIAVDFSGNVIIVGETEGELQEGKRAGSYDILVAKYSNQGERMWIRQLGGSAREEAVSVAVDKAGNIFVAGTTFGTLVPGEEKGSWDLFLIKFNAQGEQLWIKQLGSSGPDQVVAITTGAGGDVYLAGRTTGDVEPGEPEDWDILLSRYNTDGEEIWSKKIGTAEPDWAHGLASDLFGNIFLLERTINVAQSTERRKFMDFFLSKFDSEGEQFWRKQVGSPQRGVASGIGVDTFGNIFLSGTIKLEDETELLRDFFLIKLDTNGEEIWEERLGPASNAFVTNITTDGYGGILVSGLVKGELFPGQYIPTNQAFLMKWEDDLSLAQHRLIVKSYLDVRFEAVNQRLDQLNERPDGNKKELDYTLIAEAQNRTASRGDGRVSEADAKAILGLMQNGQEEISTLQQKTLAYILYSYNVTTGAKSLLLDALK